MADHMNGTPKYVVSNTLTSPAWQNTTVLAGDVKAKLLDQLTLPLHPVIVGDGSRPVFAGSSGRLPLALVDVSRFETDVLRLKYARWA